MYHASPAHDPPPEGKRRPNTMSSVRFPVAVFMQRFPVASRWTSERWEPVAAEALATDEPPGVTRVSGDQEQWRFSGLYVELHGSEAEGYHLNLTAESPRLFVMWREREPDALEAGAPPVFPVVVTASYNQAARMLDGGERVDPIAMPPLIQEWLIPYTQAHYRAEPRKKVRRNDPLADQASRGPRGADA